MMHCRSMLHRGHVALRVHLGWSNLGRSISAHRWQHHSSRPHPPACKCCAQPLRCGPHHLDLLLFPPALICGRPACGSFSMVCSCFTIQLFESDLKHANVAPDVYPDMLFNPMSWSASNAIAVSCRGAVFYQVLHTRTLANMCAVTPGRACTLAWGAGERADDLAIGTSLGAVQVWDARTAVSIYELPFPEVPDPVGALDWHGQLLAVGRARRVDVYDTRCREVVATYDGPRGQVYAAKWNPGGTLLAAGDMAGGVCLWDVRVGAGTVEKAPAGRVAHDGTVKVAAPMPDSIALR